MAVHVARLFRIKISVPAAVVREVVAVAYKPVCNSLVVVHNACVNQCNGNVVAAHIVLADILRRAERSAALGVKGTLVGFAQFCRAFNVNKQTV